MKKSVPWESALTIVTFRSIDTALQFHLALIQVEKMRIKDFLICHDKIAIWEILLALAIFGVELDI